MAGPPFSPPVRWDPGLLHPTAPLRALGPLPASPLASLSAAFTAVSRRRAQAGRDDNLFLLVRTPAAGWMVFEYDESKILAEIDFHELDTGGLPLGGSLDAPQTFLVEADGRVGRLAHEGQGAYGIRFVRREDDGTLAAPPPDAPDAPGSGGAWRVGKDQDHQVAELPLPDGPWSAEVPLGQVNHGENVLWRPRVSIRPGPHADDLAHDLSRAAAHRPGLDIKAGGSRHSWSPTAATDGIYVHPEGLKGMAALRDAPGLASTLTPAERGNLFRVGSGVTIRELNAFLWDVGKAMPALGGYDGQTVGGVLPTGTHGSVFSRGPLVEATRSLDLVRADGSKVRIEPASAPVTDPAAFAVTHGSAGWTLEQDDAVFDAALVTLGTLGVVHAYVLEVRDRFHLREVRTLTTSAELFRVLADENVHNLARTDRSGPTDRVFEGHPVPAYHLELLVNPHSDKVVVTTRHPHVLGGPEPDHFADPPTRDLFRLLAVPDRHGRPALPVWIQENFGGPLADLGALLADLVPDALPRLVDMTLEGQLPDAEFVQRSYNVFNIGRGANNVPALSATVYAPVEGDAFLRALEVIRQVAGEWGGRNLYHTGPISLRFVRGSRAMLACPVDVCSFELIFLAGTEHARDLVGAYTLALVDALGRDRVWVHWGQIVEGFDSAAVPLLYPRYSEWWRIRDRFDPGGRFLNRWQRSVLPPPA